MNYINLSNVLAEVNRKVLNNLTSYFFKITINGQRLSFQSAEDEEI